jgi:ribosomal protein S6E (S10)
MKRIFLVALFGMAVLFVNAQTRTEVKTADLNKAITENVAKDYAGFTIKDAFKSDVNGVVTYEVKIAKGTETEVLVYDKDGKFVKKEARKAGTATKKEAPKKK